MIHAWHAACEQGLSAIPADALKPLEHEFRHAVLAGLASVPRVPGPKNSTKQKPGRDLLEFCKERRDDVTRFCDDTRIWPTNNISERGVRPLKTCCDMTASPDGEFVPAERRLAEIQHRYGTAPGTWSAGQSSVPRR